MHVYDAAAEAEQMFAVDESQHFGRTGLTGGLQASEVGQCLRAARGGPQASSPMMSAWISTRSLSRSWMSVSLPWRK